jgi:hypothetical protein
MVAKTDSMDSLSVNKRQRLIQQAKEVSVFFFLAVVRIFMTYFAGALNSPSNTPLHSFKAMLGAMVLAQRGPMLVFGGVVFGYAFLSLACGRLLHRKFLDFLGILVLINLLFHFLKINLLLFTPSGPPVLLLGQLITFVIFFIVAWGWIYWRVDCAEHEGSAGIIALGDTGETLSMFDYMYSSMHLIQTMGRASNISGSTRFGRVLVSVHNFMVIDLVSIGLGRFYQLIQKTI